MAIDEDGEHLTILDSREVSCLERFLRKVERVVTEGTLEQLPFPVLDFKKSDAHSVRLVRFIGGSIQARQANANGVKNN